MSLSPENNIGMRSGGTSEEGDFIRASRYASPKNPAIAQAINLGLISKVEITPQEADLYKSLREQPLGPTDRLKSDQVLMAEDVLTGEKQQQFMRAFPHIFPSLQ